jgi:transcriptional regulator with XRE-family HTH domain
VLDIALVVGQNIARLRHERGWTLQDLASYLDTNAQNVSGIEKGRRGISIKQIARLVDVFGCVPADLFTLPIDVDGDLIYRQLVKEIEIMTREDRATLCAHAVALNASRGLKPE